jgi:hypothetical protein
VLRIDTLPFLFACFCFCILTSVWNHVFFKHSFNFLSFAAVSFSIVLPATTQVKSETLPLSDLISCAGAYERGCFAGHNCQY